MLKLNQAEFLITFYKFRLCALIEIANRDRIYCKAVKDLIAQVVRKYKIWIGGNYNEKNKKDYFRFICNCNTYVS